MYAYVLGSTIYIVHCTFVLDEHEVLEVHTNMDR